MFYSCWVQAMPEVVILLQALQSNYNWSKTANTKIVFFKVLNYMLKEIIAQKQQKSVS